VSVVAAGALVVLKLGTGLVVGSLGLVSAGIESSGDVVAAVLTLFAIRLGGQPADADHPYGHRRAENLAALGEAAILTGGGIVVVVEAIGRLAGHGRPIDAHWYVFAVIVVALAVDLSTGARVTPWSGSVQVRGAALQRVSLRQRSPSFTMTSSCGACVCVSQEAATSPMPSCPCRPVRPPSRATARLTGSRRLSGRATRQ
jgi:cation diffusion facilitator family transporter